MKIDFFKNMKNFGFFLSPWLNFVRFTSKTANMFLNMRYWIAKWFQYAGPNSYRTRIFLIEALFFTKCQISPGPSLRLNF